MSVPTNRRIAAIVLSDIDFGFPFATFVFTRMRMGPNDSSNDPVEFSKGLPHSRLAGPDNGPGARQRLLLELENRNPGSGKNGPTGYQCGSE